ncbi:MAG: hypothetical protein GF317_18860 [Candidatus Lokiarchaeota archaeon]|jgi:hypothetical protein|nr:hypothetical protein [Candidatus Lokiarchaeota archaeon]MBD3201579.1 hypothetical protein [Candidatus Lokiarchaeota archaeon]
MFKKKKVREEFDEVFKSGDESRIKKMLNENPWLLDEVSQQINEVMDEEQQVIAALGIMEDELAKPAPLQDIVFSLKVDLNVSKSEEEVLELLKNVEKLELVKNQDGGWSLTGEGGRICDDYLNKNLKKVDIT